MRDMCLRFASLLMLKERGINLKYSHNSPADFAAIENGSIVIVCVCVLLVHYVWNGKSVWLMTTASILCSLHCSRFSIVFAVQRLKLELIVEGCCSEKSSPAYDLGLILREASTHPPPSTCSPLHIEQSFYGEVCDTLIAALWSSPWSKVFLKEGRD